MDKFKGKFYDFMRNAISCEMIQYYSSSRRKPTVVSKVNIEGGVIYFLITDPEHEKIDEYEAIEYFKTQGVNFELQVIILASEVSEYEHIQGISRVVINKDNYEVMYFDERCRGIAEIIPRFVEDTNFAENDKSKRSRFLEYKIPTLIIISMNIIIFLIYKYLSYKTLGDIAASQGISISQLSEKIKNVADNVTLVAMGAKYGPAIYDGQIWRLLTCAFLHGGIIHIGCNMYMLYYVGPQVESIFGKFKFVSIYLVSCITSSLLSLIVNPDSISVGASGGIFGLLGALLAFVIIEKKNINKKYRDNLIQTIVINLLIGIAISKIDNAAHIGGFLGGGILSFIIYKFIKKNSINLEK